MAFEQEGVLHKIFETQSKTESFQAREFVIKLDGNYPQFIKFQLTQDKCDLINNYKEGDKIKVSFDLRGREWNEKYFTNLNACKIVAGATEDTPTGPPESFDPIATPAPEVSSNNGQKMSVEDFDDLPF